MHLGATYHLIIVTGIRFNDVSVVGAIRGIGETILEAIVDGPDFESCSHLALSCLLWPLAAVLETAKTLVLQRILDAPAGIDQLHIRKNQSSN